MYVFYDVSSHYPELNEVVGKMVQRMLCHDAHIRLESNAGFKLLQIEIFHFSETSDLIQKGLEVKNTVSYKYSRTKIEKKIYISSKFLIRITHILRNPPVILEVGPSKLILTF